MPAISSERAVTVTAAKNVCFENTIPLTGVVAPKKEVLVRPDREGLQISQINAQAGDTVRSGQVLARLIPPEGQPAGNVEVQSPVAGLVTSSSAMVGAIVSAQGMPLFQIAERGEMELVAETPVETLQTLALNQPAKIEVIGIAQLSGKSGRFQRQSIRPHSWVRFGSPSATIHACASAPSAARS